MSAKPKNIVDLFPEICETVKNGRIKNVQVKARYANKNCSPETETYQICQVLQDSKCPEKVIIIKETLVKWGKESASNAKTNNTGEVPPVPKCDKTDKKCDHKSVSYRYCKEVIQPYLDPNKKSANELACEAVDVASQDFPMFKYCCDASRQSPPLIVKTSCIKNPTDEPPPPIEKPKCKPSAASVIKDAAGCVAGTICGVTTAVTDGASYCLGKVFKSKKSDDCKEDDSKSKKK